MADSRKPDAKEGSDVIDFATFLAAVRPKTAIELRLGYVLERTDLILDNAFEDIVTLLREGRAGSDAAPWTGVPAVQAPIFQGRP